MSDVDNIVGELDPDQIQCTECSTFKELKKYDFVRNTKGEFIQKPICDICVNKMLMSKGREGKGTYV